MTDKQKIEGLKHAFEDTIWMAVRYANGRHTYAPTMVRDAIKQFKTIFPEWKLREDITIEPPDKEDLGGFKLKEDYLYDVFE